MDSRQTLLRRIDTYLNTIPVRTSDVEYIGPFTLFFRRDSTIPEITYARPSAPLTGGIQEHLAGVRAAFARHGRVCRWEFLADLFPDFPKLLVQNGFSPPIARPLMVVTPAAFRPEHSARADIRKIDASETRAVSQMLGMAFGGNEGEMPLISDEEPDFLLASLARGTAAYAAFSNGTPVAAGSHAPLGDTTEVAGIGTLPAFRRQGLAGAVTSALVADAFAQHCTCVFLSAADETVQRLYARLGFAKVGVAMDTT